MRRREFNKVCGSLLAGAATLQPMSLAKAQPFPRASLVYDDDSPVTIDSIEPGNSFVFSYPYVTTPCFILRLDHAATKTDSWHGGVGDDGSVVAFSAICSHKMSHPAKPISHINFRQEEISFYDRKGNKKQQSQLISCCSERSVYDPSNGAAVLSGPAPAPLAAISLDVNENGQLVATGSTGADQYEPFLKKFGFRLALEYGVTDVRARVGDKTIATMAQHFSSQQIRC